jgi:hypothetical protein
MLGFSIKGPPAHPFRLEYIIPDVAFRIPELPAQFDRPASQPLPDVRTL